MLVFEKGMDDRCREVTVPSVARFNVGNGVYRYVVIGTQYGYVHTTGGDVRTWGSYSAARRFANNYVGL